MRRRVLQLASVVLITFLLTGAASAWAQARPGGLDQSFGRQGKVVTALPIHTAGEAGGSGFEIGSDPSGRLLVADSRFVVRYLADGTIDRSFGQGGFAGIPMPPGGDFQLAGVASDSLGRILLAGTMSFDEVIAPVPVSPDSPPQQGLAREEAAIYRLDPGGSPDPGFGRDGLLLSRFDLAPPKNGAGQSYQGTPVQVTGMALDGSDRPLLTGSFVSSVSVCRDISFAVFHRAFVARMTPDATLDPTFGAGGTVIQSRIAALMPVLGGSGEIVYAGIADGGFDGCESSNRIDLGRLDSNGVLDPGFGRQGWAKMAAWITPPVIDSRGRILVAEGSLSARATGLRVERLNAGGRRDRGFGAQGLARIHLPKVERTSARTALAVGRDDGVMVGWAGHGPVFTVAHLTRSGRLDRRFGRGGLAATRFDGTLRALRLLPDGRGRFVFAGLIKSAKLPGGEGFVLCRYRAGG